MATRHSGMRELAPPHDNSMLALGGAPLPAARVSADDHDKAARKRRKSEAKLRRDAERPPESFERFRILAELVNEGRRVVELADHKARYALVVIGVLNAGGESAGGGEAVAGRLLGRLRRPHLPLRLLRGRLSAAAPFTVCRHHVRNWRWRAIRA